MRSKNYFLLLILALCVSVCNNVSANCTECTVVSNGGSNDINLSQNQTLCIKSGVFSGNINLNGNANICIAEGAVFNVGNINSNNRSFNITNNGTMNVRYGLNVGGNSTITNNGTVNLNGNINYNKPLVINNNGVWNSNVNFDIKSNGSKLINDGVLTSVSLTIDKDVEVVNNHRLTVKGQTNIQGAFTNNGFVVAEDFININSHAKVTNNCTFYSNKGFNYNSNYSFYNHGLIRADGDVQFNQGTFYQSEKGLLVGINFNNNTYVNGTGSYFFTGFTRNNGGDKFGSDGLKINFFDESSSKKSFFDEGNLPHASVTRVKIAQEDTTLISNGCSAKFPTPIATDVVYYAELNKVVIVPLQEIAWDTAVGLDIVATNIMVHNPKSQSNGRAAATGVYVDPGKGTYTFYGREGVIEFQPEQDYAGVSTIDYVVMNTLGYKSNLATVTIIIEPSPLPVELVYFEGELTAGEVELNWLTASEKNNDYFQVERSADGVNFEAIGTVDGNGNSVSPIQYAFVDVQPLAGVSYYRLLQVDFDGQSEYSKVIAIENAAKVELTLNVYPVPTTDEVTVQSTESIQSLRVIDTKGSIVKAQKLNANQVKLSLADLTPGMYLVQVDYTNGGNKTVQVLKR